MKKIGIIGEYNPFHNGHIYHLQKIKEMFPDSLIILAMSPSFTMRGEVSLLNKWDKTEISLKYGVDLVIELPTFYATNSADTFSEGAVKILSLLDCDYLVFGSESNDLEYLKLLANTQIQNTNYDYLVKKYLDLGHNYPTSMAKALEEITGKRINLPNDLLGLSYIKQMILQKSKIKPITILRTNSYHETTINQTIASATSIRKAIEQKEDFKKTVPKETYEKIILDDVSQNFFYLLKYQIINNLNTLDTFLDVDEGLDNKIRKVIFKITTYQELIAKIKTKRYTYNRLNRMFLHILLNIKKVDVIKRKELHYIRILGFSQIGKKYLKEQRTKINIPIITNYSDIDNANLNFELNCTMIYHQIINRPDLDLVEFKSIPIEKS